MKKLSVLALLLSSVGAGSILSGTEADTLFHRVKPERSGVVATNDYQDIYGKFQDYIRGALGTGVAIADLDKDGRPDLLTISKTEPMRVYRNEGDFHFRDVTEQWGLLASSEEGKVWKQGVAVADVNNDGWLDIYVSRFDAPNQLFIRQSDGRYREEAAKRGLAIVDGSNQAYFFDYDRDGLLDVYTQTNLYRLNHPTGEPDRLFHNQGDGFFKEVTSEAGIYGATQGHGAVWWDYDDDGWPDLYVANDFEEPDRLYRNNGDGTFSDAISLAAPWIANSSMGVDVGDINNDGRIDLLVADMAASNHEKDMRGMANRRLGGIEPVENPKLLRQYLLNSLLLNTGTGRMVEVGTMAGVSRTDWTWSVLFDDLDLDGKVDVHFTNGVMRELHNLDVTTRFYTSASEAERQQILRNCPVFNEENFAFRNLGDLRFESVGKKWGLDEFGVSFGAATGDLDGDGDLDLFYGNFRTPFSLLRNDQKGGRSLIFDLIGHRSNSYGIGAKITLFSGDEKQVRVVQPIRGYLSSSEPIAFFGTTSWSKIDRAEIRWPSGIVQVLEKPPLQGRLKIEEPNVAPPPLVMPAPLPSFDSGYRVENGQFVEVSEAAGMALPTRETRFNELRAQPLLPQVFNRVGPAAAAADLNGDGRDDFVIGGTLKDPLRVLLSQENGSYRIDETLGQAAALRTNHGPLLLADFNGDGIDDLLLTAGGVNLEESAADYVPHLFLGKGQGSYALDTNAMPAWQGPASSLVAADFDHDGDLDVVLAQRTAPGQFPKSRGPAVWRNDGGRFVDVTEAVAPELAKLQRVASLWMGDMDGDARVDLVVGQDWGPVTIFRQNERGQLVPLSSEVGTDAAGQGWWLSIAAADFNGDGIMDFVLGNGGANTTHSSPTGLPLEIFSGEFTGAKGQQIVEGFHDQGRLVPRRARSTLSPVFRNLMAKYPRNDDYSRATLAEVFGADQLAKAQHILVDQLESGVLVSQNGQLKWKFQSLPREAQIAPMQGIVCADVDGDGALDIYALQNSYDPIPEYGRWDGGLSVLLRGDGKGAFRNVPLLESGLLVTGDTRALVATDFNQDGWVDFLLTRNNGTSAAFLNRGKPDRTPWPVQLKGGGVGARVTAVWKSGKRQTLAITAGSSRLSQSSTVAFFGAASADPIDHFEVLWPSGKRTTHKAVGEGLQVLAP